MSVRSESYIAPPFQAASITIGSSCLLFPDLPYWCVKGRLLCACRWPIKDMHNQHRTNSLPTTKSNCENHLPQPTVYSIAQFQFISSQSTPPLSHPLCSPPNRFFNTQKEEQRRGARADQQRMRRGGGENKWRIRRRMRGRMRWRMRGRITGKMRGKRGSLYPFERPAVRRRGYAVTIFP